MNKVRHIFFDLDNTLWDFDRNSRETLADVFDEHQLGDRSGKEKAFFIDRYLHHNERYWDMYRQNRVSKSRLRSARFEAALRDLGIDDKSLARGVANSYMAQCPTKPNLHQGAKEVLEAFHERFVLHILSNGFQEVQHVKLRTTGIDGYFTSVTTSERASAKKPDPRIFQFAMKVSGAKPEESLMIGDSVSIDVEGALNAGWSAVHYNPGNEEHGYASVRHLDELPLLFDGGD